MHRHKGYLLKEHAHDRNWAGQCTEPDDADNVADRKTRPLRTKHGRQGTEIHANLEAAEML